MEKNWENPIPTLPHLCTVLTVSQWDQVFGKTLRANPGSQRCQASDPNLGQWV